MSCPNCKDIIDLNIFTPTEWEFVPKYKFKITMEDFYKDSSFNDYTRLILEDFSKGKIKHKQVSNFIELGFYKEIPVKTICPKCNSTYETFRLCYYGTIYEEYNNLIEELFLDAFKVKFHADGSFLYDHADEIPYLTELYFKKTKKQFKPLFKLIHIKNEIPNEKGGEPEYLKYVVETIALGLFSNFLYQLFFQDKVENLKEYIKARQENYKKRINNKKILKQLEKYMKNENVEWNKETALQMINNELENLIAKYIDAIQE